MSSCRATNAKPYSIIANKSYGLYCGTVESFDAVTGVAVVSDCRHVARWYGKTGGITSLAAYGLCGPEADKSRIGDGYGDGSGDGSGDGDGGSAPC